MKINILFVPSNLLLHYYFDAILKMCHILGSFNNFPELKTDASFSLQTEMYSLVEYLEGRQRTCWEGCAARPWCHQTAHVACHQPQHPIFCLGPHLRRAPSSGAQTPLETAIIIVN